LLSAKVSELGTALELSIKMYYENFLNLLLNTDLEQKFEHITQNVYYIDE